MAYRRPAVQISQIFQRSAAALALPQLPACIVGPGFQIANGVDVGTYEASPVTFPYTGLAVGGVVDTAETPTAEEDANVFKRVSVTLKDAYLELVPATGSEPTTGKLATPNVFTDLTSGAFAAFDPAATNAPQYYVDVLDGPGINAGDLGRKLVIAKTDDNNLKVASNWLTSLPELGVTYRIVVFRATEALEEGHAGVTLATTGVTLGTGLLTATDATPLRVLEADVQLAWRALRTDLAGTLNAFTDTDSITAIFGTGSIVPANIGAYAVFLALENTATAISFCGMDADWFDNEEVSYTTALEFLKGKDVYALALLTQNVAVHQAGKTHVNLVSDPTVGRERVCIVNRKLSSTAVIEPTSGTGTITSAGSGNGTSGTHNVTFKDPTNGAFVNDAVKPGYFLEIASYTAVAGSQRVPAADERDFLLDAGTNIARLGNAAFVGGDVGKIILVKGATTAGNNTGVFTIASIVSGLKAAVTENPAATEELPSTARTWITTVDRTVTHNAADSVVAATKTWHFVNGAFVAGDVGKLLFMVGTAAAGDKGVFTIATVVSSTNITTLEAPGADETFGGGVTQKIYQISREVIRDAASDTVNGTSRNWTVLNGNFTAEDVGRILRVAGAQNAGNNADHVIEAVLSATIVRTSNSTTPVTEVFDGILGSVTFDVRSTTPSTSEDTFITTTRHEILSVDSNQQVTLVADPTDGFGGTLGSVHYSVTRDLTKDEEAALIGGYSTSLGSRRVVATWPDIVDVSVSSVATPVPGYFAGAAIAGMTAGLPAHQGFTNLSLTGFVGRANSDDRYTDDQLDVIAGGGTLVLTQPVAGAALLIRHQLTTDTSTIDFQEYSVTRTVDLVARFLRSLFGRFLGPYNVGETLIDMVKTRGEGGFKFLKAQRSQGIGAPIRSGALTLVQESTTDPDFIDVEATINVPVPLNGIRVKLLV